MGYLAYHFVVEPPQPGSEILVALIADMGFESFDFSEEGFSAFINETNLPDVHLDDLSFSDFAYHFTVEKIEAKNWNAEWEKNFEPVVVDDLLCIRAPFHPANTQVEQEIVIMPKMSFGTGHHQTTRLMCRQMFEAELKNKRVLDMGCGTAILAILAAKLGASEILGVDIDAWSVENAKENCAGNNCSQIEIRKGDIELMENERAFDLILANINKNVLKNHLATYSGILVKGGKLFLSGFFTTDKEDLTNAAEKYDLNMSHSTQENEWALMVLEKN